MPRAIICAHGSPVYTCEMCRSERNKESIQRHIEKIGRDEWNRRAGERRKTRRQDDPSFRAEECRRSREYNARVRDEVLNAYGGPVCACCGEKELTFLTIDHIGNDGAEHRRSIGVGRAGGGNFYRWLKKNKFPSGFQVLCMNCNFGKALNGGVCPHQTKNLHTAV